MPRFAPVTSLVTRCRMRELRGETRLLAMQATTGISAGTLSQFERMQRFPTQAQYEALELGYGPRSQWYSVDLMEVAA